MTKLNKSTTFIRPLLGLANNAYTDNYRNCYITLEPEMLIHLVFDNTEPTEHQRATFQSLDCLHSFRDKYVDGSNLIYTFTPDEETRGEVAKFVSGHYSHMSEGAKQTILFSQHNVNNVTMITNILWPNDDTRKKLSELLGESLGKDAEVYSRPDIEEEIFDITKL